MEKDKRVKLHLHDGASRICWESELPKWIELSEKLKQEYMEKGMSEKEADRTTKILKIEYLD